MAAKTLFSSAFYLAAFFIKFILFYSLNMLVPTMETEEPSSAVEVEMEEPKMEAYHGICNIL